MVSGLNETRFLISCHRKNSVGDKVTDKRICLGKNTTQSVGHLRRQEVPGYGVVSFYRGG